MEPGEIIEALIEQKKTAIVLSKGSSSREEVHALQLMLGELGFGSKPDWQEKHRQGIYGRYTVNAVKSFASRNHIECDGGFVSLEVAQKLLYRYNSLGAIHCLYRLIKEGTVTERLRYESPHTGEVAALQKLLKDLGYGQTLNWRRYGADGRFGKNTAAAISLFARLENIPCAGERVTTQLAARIICKLQGYYGHQWVKIVPRE